ncbi:DUF397 domain-containing protein [Actinomadura graeca]|uniref:DUF397 domain-containing protein n=1 Tax=Actinomadura graeca TaxID=2750812 RepID=A0ABX8QZB0_9ACTN|nr:DUF397 domain-containing protein [Actinomadura graeca]QXJ22118.1 DUF397 domain-containing protein [Actinomadura graeca]
MNTPEPSKVQWRKSSRSGGQGGACVEVASHSAHVAVRDSKDPDGPRLVFGGVAWRVFAERVKASGFDLEG